MENNITKKLIILCIVYLWLKVYSKITTSICIIRGIVGFPCPGCGITRAYMKLLHGDLLEAMYYNPLFIVPIIILYFYLFNKKYLERSIYIIGFLSISCYIIRLYYMFPCKEPMTWNYNAIIFKIIRFLKEAMPQ